MAQILVGATIEAALRRYGRAPLRRRAKASSALDLACRGKRRFCGTAERPGMGRFKLGSTVINLFAPGKVAWLSNWKACLSRKLASRWQYYRNLCYARC